MTFLTRSLMALLAVFMTMTSSTTMAQSISFDPSTWRMGYDEVICPYITTAINYYLGTRQSCRCRRRHTLFLPGKLPFFRLGIDAECSYAKTDEMNIDFNTYFRGGFVNTEICHDLDSVTRACFYGSYFLDPEWVFTFNHQPKSCKVEINGQRCASCAFIGRPPVSAMMWDCGDLLPPEFADFDFNQVYPNEPTARLDDFILDQLTELLEAGNMTDTGGRRQLRG